MATIISQGLVGDGYDVRVRSAGQIHTLHFLEEPASERLADTIEHLERRLFDEITANYNLDIEEFE